MASSHQAFLERFGGRGASAAQLAVSYAMAENTFAVTSGGFGRPPAMESWTPSALTVSTALSRCPQAAPAAASW